MRCIFCKSDSSNSKSVEHVIPESLGNKEHVLRPGIVCDTCNQYFALKIEKPVLESNYFRSVRHRNDIESKKDRIPLDHGIMGGIVQIDKSSEGRSIIVNNSRTIQGILDGTIKHMIVGIYDSPEPNNKDLSRFIGKIALESLAQRYTDDDSLDSLVDDPSVDSLRNYVRFGNKPKMWEYHQRRIYPEGVKFCNPKVSPEAYEVLHETTLFMSSPEDAFAVIVIMGIEYVINFCDPSIDTYKKWLEENNNASPVDEDRIIVEQPPPNWSNGDHINFVTTKR